MNSFLVGCTQILVMYMHGMYKHILVYTKTCMYVHAYLGMYMLYTCMYRFTKSCPGGQDSRWVAPADGRGDRAAASHGGGVSAGFLLITIIAFNLYYFNNSK